MGQATLPKAMSDEPKRYCIVADYKPPFAKMNEFADGEFVRYEDYAGLKAENERLIKAGDAMAFELEPSLKYNPSCEDIRYQVRLWNAAKEGKDL